MMRAKNISTPALLLFSLFIWIFAELTFASSVSGEQWRGLTVAPENRCSPYNRKRDYRYPQSVEQEIVHRLGAIYSPYTGTCFQSMKETDIEHIVSMSEAHDSGLCRSSRAVRSRFARDIRNLTLASPHLNRREKVDKDASQWVPARNQCWFAGRIVEVRRAYGLTIDKREAAALEKILSGCDDTLLEPVICHRSSSGAPQAESRTGMDETPLSRYDDNRNGIITCKEARRHGIAPVPRNHPAYVYMIDRDEDGTVCE